MSFLKPFLKLIPLCLIVLLAGAVPSEAEEPKTIAILPFTMNAEKDLTYLQEGIMDMLGSRLAWKDKLQVVEKPLVKRAVRSVEGPLNADKALTLGRDLEADYVILGSLTVFGESVSLDAKILDVSEGEELVTAFKQTRGMEEVIPAVNAFAEDINAKVMGRYVPPSTYAGGPQQPVQQEPGALVAAEGGSGSPDRKVRHVQRVSLEILGLDVGDVDGDGQTEVVFFEEDKLFVYKWRESRFIQLAEIEKGWARKYLYVSVADLNGNNKAEIYLSNSGGETLSSMVLEWQGNGLKTIADGEPWFMRVVEVPGKGKRLIGQKRRTGGNFAGDVRYLEWEKSGVIAKERVNLPPHSNVFNFCYFPVEQGQQTLTVLLDNYEKLRVFDEGGGQIWRSGEEFGGSLTSLSPPSTNEVTKATKKRIYISSPIFLENVDEDPERELVICQNHSRTLRLTETFREFDSGKVHFMVWDQVGLTTEWTSQKVSGAVVGYAVSDVDHDGLPELIIAAVTKQRHFVGMGKQSQIVVYDLK